MSSIHIPDSGGDREPLPSETGPVVESIATECIEVLSVTENAKKEDSVFEDTSVKEGPNKKYKVTPNKTGYSSKKIENRKSHYADIERLLDEGNTDEILYIQIPLKLQELHDKWSKKAKYLKYKEDLKGIIIQAQNKDITYTRDLSNLISSMIGLFSSLHQVNESIPGKLRKIIKEMSRLQLLGSCVTLKANPELLDNVISSKEFKIAMMFASSNNNKAVTLLSIIPEALLSTILETPYRPKIQKFESTQDMEGIDIMDILESQFVFESTIKMRQKIESIVMSLARILNVVIYSWLYLFFFTKAQINMTKEQKKYQDIINIFDKYLLSVGMNSSRNNSNNKLNIDLIARKFNFPLPKDANFHNTIDDTMPNIFITGISEDSLALAREVDRQSLSNAIIVPNLSDIKSKRLGSRAYIKAGIVYRGGQIYNIEPGAEAIEGHYVFSGASNDKDSLIFNKKNVPQAGMRYMDFYTQNKEITSDILRKSGINTPLKAYFVGNKKLGKQYRYASRKMTPYKNNEEGYEAMIESFIEKGVDEVVIKPTGGSQGRDVYFVELPTEREKAKKAIKEVINNGENVIVEERIQSIPIEIEGEKMDWNLRVFVSRNSNGPVVSDIEIRIDHDGKPVNISISAKVLKFEALKELVDMSPMEFDVLKAQVEEISVGAFSALESHIRENEYVEDHDKQDFMGIDVIVKQVSGGLVPFIIEVNDQASGGMWDLDDVESPENIGKSSRDLAKLMSKRATEYMNR